MKKVIKKNLYDAACMVVENHQFAMIKQESADSETYLINQEDFEFPMEWEEETAEVPNSLKGFTLLDAMTANLLKSVYEMINTSESLSDEKRDRLLLQFKTKPLGAVVNWCWKLTK